MISFSEIELQVLGRGGGGAQGAPAGNGETLQIDWETFDERLYDGEPPSETWTGILNTEGGWTEK
jgi:hypothetical protein